MGPLYGKYALITGGTTGIGRATALSFHAAGARVIVTGQSEDSSAQAQRELPKEITVLRSDVRSIAAASALADHVRKHFGELDALFLNVGIAHLAPFEAIDEAHYDAHMDTNVKGVVFTLQELDALKE